MTAAEARAKAVKCGRHVNILIDIREYEIAHEQLAEARRWSLLAVHLEAKEKEVRP